MASEIDTGCIKGSDAGDGFEYYMADRKGFQCDSDSVTSLTIDRCPKDGSILRRLASCTLLVSA